MKFKNVRYIAGAALVPIALEAWPHHDGYVRKYSDTLLIMPLNGRRPEVFKHPSKIELAGANRVPCWLRPPRRRLSLPVTFKPFSLRFARRRTWLNAQPTQSTLRL